MLDVLFLTQSGETLPSVRFRVLPYVRNADSHGKVVSWKSVPKTLTGRVPFYALLPKARTIVLQKKFVSSQELRLLRRKSLKLAFDFDDALWTCHPNVPPGRAREKACAKGLKRLRSVCSSVDLVLAGNMFLAQKVRSYTDRVEVLPTPIDTEVYTPDSGSLGDAPVTLDEEVTVGWMGTSCNLFFLPNVFEMLRPLAGNTQFLVVSDEPYPFPQGFSHAAFLHWNSDLEVLHLREMDIGLMPLTNDEYTRGKCGFKLLQYMACGVVPVASDVGFNREIITHGQDGFLVKHPSEWIRYVGLLVQDAYLRRKMAISARQKVVEQFSLARSAERLWRILG
ncbi:MAG: glycosyltransferase family 4 protein [Thermodesulfobacteriota bacterium]|nr:glycosyltransferase family 4 protein [Thermodesulfobacteriota bacterium]